MASFPIVPVTELQAIASAAVQGRITTHVKKLYERILREARKGGFFYAGWFSAGENGELMKEDVAAIAKVKELFPGISMRQELMPSKEIVCTFNWHT
jgi:hypothetical protein